MRVHFSLLIYTKNYQNFIPFIFAKQMYDMVEKNGWEWRVVSTVGCKTHKQGWRMQGFFLFLL